MGVVSFISILTEINLFFPERVPSIDHKCTKYFYFKRMLFFLVITLNFKVK